MSRFLPRLRAATASTAAFVIGSLAASQGTGAVGEQSELHAHERLARPTALKGVVREPSGVPARAALVMSSAGGQARTGEDGRYVLEVCLPPAARAVQITAFGRGAGGPVASTTVALPGTSVAPLDLVVGKTCLPSWLPTFGAKAGTDARIFTLAVFDDGGGPSLYVGGTFTTVGTVPASRIARWDGSCWSALGGGCGGAVRAMIVFDDGGGPDLYAGGNFSSAGGVTANRVARWDGTSWSALGKGMSGQVHALATFDDGNGEALIAGGQFQTAGGVSASNLARWDGSTWSPLGSGVGDRVASLRAWDDGSGPALYVGGDFSVAGGMPAASVARWNGTSWSSLSNGLIGSVSALEVFDAGASPGLIAGGSFLDTGDGLKVNHVARWDGTSWSSFGGGLAIGVVDALSVFDDGSGPGLYAGGIFLDTGDGLRVNHVARWDGSSWSSLGQGVGGRAGVAALETFDDGNGPALFAGGRFTTAGSTFVDKVGRWDGSGWSGLGSGLTGAVNAIEVFDDGSGPALYAAGEFRTDAPLDARVAKWNGRSWISFGASWGQSGDVHDLARHDDGSGPALFVAGTGITKWDGSAWSTVGFFEAHTMTVFDDGSGPALYAGTTKWNGAEWSSLEFGGNRQPFASVVFDDGSGPALVVAGHFQFRLADLSLARNAARWDGSSWTRLRTQMSLFSEIRALAVFDDGNGPALFAGGLFASIGGVQATGVARWDGVQWSPLGSGIAGGAGLVRALTVHDDGRGSALYAGGDFTVAGGVAVQNLARWDGSTWSAVAGGVDSEVRVLKSHTSAAGSVLYVGGSFPVANSSGDSYVTQYACDLGPPVLDHPASVEALERPGSAPGEIVVFSVTATDTHDPAPRVECVPASGSLFPPGTTLVACTATDRSGNRSVRQFPVTVGMKVRTVEF